ncbi:unnamed protein product, partial [Didymodactylos carnosus]
IMNSKSDSKRKSTSLYDRFINAFVDQHKGTRKDAYADGNTRWKSLKLEGHDEIEEEISRMIIEGRKGNPKTQTLFTSWASANKSYSYQLLSTSNLSSELSDKSTPLLSLSVVSEKPLVSSPESNDKSKQEQPNLTSKVEVFDKTPCPQQEIVKKQLSDIETSLAGYISLKNKNLLTSENLISMRSLNKQREKLRKTLKRLEQVRVANAKSRRNKQLKLKSLNEKYPQIFKEFDILPQESSGRPHIEAQTGQNALLDVIAEIAGGGGAADRQRSTNLIAACMSLDDLHKELIKRGFKLSRSSTYLRLIHIELTQVKVNGMLKQHQLN